MENPETGKVETSQKAHETDARQRLESSDPEIRKAEEARQLAGIDALEPWGEGKSLSEADYGKVQDFVNKKYGEWQTAMTKMMGELPDDSQLAQEMRKAFYDVQAKYGGMYGGKHELTEHTGKIPEGIDLEGLQAMAKELSVMIDSFEKEVTAEKTSLSEQIMSVYVLPGVEKSGSRSKYTINITPRIGEPREVVLDVSDGVTVKSIGNSVMLAYGTKFGVLEFKKDAESGSVLAERMRGGALWQDFTFSPQPEFSRFIVAKAARRTDTSPV